MAKDIKTGDNIITSDGYVKVISNKMEIFSKEVKVYNFNVLGYHTYVVGNERLVVQNACSSDTVEPTERHYIVEQCQSKSTRSGFNMADINNHTIDIPKSTHHKISSFYSSKGAVKE